MGMALHAGEPLAEGVHRIAAERAAAAIGHLTDDLDRDWDDAVHSARKRCKEVRALARLLRGTIGDAYRPTNVAFRDAARELSAARDAWVLVEALGDLTAGTGLPEHDARVARTALVGRHETIRSALQSGDRVTGARARLVSASTLLDGWTVADDGWDALADGLEKVYRRGRHALDEVRGSQDGPLDATAHTWHDWRKRVKYLWYHLQVLAPAWQAPLDALADEAKHLSDLLGDDHDLAVLGAVLRDEDLGLDAAVRETVARSARRQRTRLREAALPLGERLYAEKPGRFTRRMGRYVSIWRSDADAHARRLIAV